MAAPAIRVDGVWKAYQIGVQANASPSFREAVAGVLGGRRKQRETFWALRDVSFDVMPGEAVGIIGSNGAGKSTLLKILSRITEPTRGSTTIRGRVTSLLEVGTGFHGDLTGRENVFLNGAILGMRRAEIQKRFDEIVDFAEIGQFLDTPVKHYSSGMYVRLAFAVAAHLEPDVLIVDEVLAVGDVVFQNKCLRKLRAIAQTEGRTVLLVSHNMQSVRTLTQRSVVLEHGACTGIEDSERAVLRYVRTLTDERPVWTGPAHPGEPRIVRAALETSRPGNIQRHGDAMKLALEVDMPEGWQECALAFEICNAQAVPVVHGWAYDRKRGIVRAPGRHRVVCEFPRVRLYMGPHHFRLYLSLERTGKEHQLVHHACPFEVVMPEEMAEFPWRPDAAVYLEDCQWTG